MKAPATKPERFRPPNRTIITRTKNREDLPKMPHKVVKDVVRNDQLRMDILERALQEKSHQSLKLWVAPKFTIDKVS